MRALIVALLVLLLALPAHALELKGEFAQGGFVAGKVGARITDAPPASASRVTKPVRKAGGDQGSLL